MKHLLIRIALLIGLAAAGAQAVAPETFRFRSGDLVVHITPDLPGGTLRLPLGPFGDLTWKTHTGPLNVEARFLVGSSATDLPDLQEFRDLRFAFLLRKVPWLVIAGILAGLLLLEGPPRKRLIAAGAGAGATTLIAIIAVTVSALTFDARALRDPRYEGPISDAPRVLQLLKEVQRDWAGVERNINRAVAGLHRLHDQVVTAAPAPANGTTVKLLLISDIHNNPIGLMIARELAERFHADGVLNAGDLTDRGTQAEGELFARFGDLGLPQVIAAGNHEDRATLERIRTIPLVTVLEAGRADIAEIGGVRILGDADPNAYLVDSNPFNDVAEREIPRRCDALAARYRSERPEVLLVHDRRLGECAAAIAREQLLPLVFAWGHAHEPAYEVRDTVLSVSPGTSGAAGFKSDVVLPYGFSLLEFDATTKAPVSVCQFEFEGPSALRSTTCHIVGASGARDARARVEPRLSPSPATRR